MYKGGEKGRVANTRFSKYSLLMPAMFHIGQSTWSQSKRLLENLVDSMHVEPMSIYLSREKCKVDLERKMGESGASWKFYKALLKHPRHHVLNESFIWVKRENSSSIKEVAERPLARKYDPEFQSLSQVCVVLIYPLEILSRIRESIVVLSSLFSQNNRTILV